MDSQNELKNVIAKNISHYRKLSGLTQVELASQLNFSDKSISKWERGDGVPDIFVLNEMARIFNITISDLLTETPKEKSKREFNRRYYLCLIFMTCVWAVTSIIYTLLCITTTGLPKLWLCFIYPIPISALIAMLFSLKNLSARYTFWLSSLVIWSAGLAIFLSLDIIPDQLWLIFVVGIPLEGVSYFIYAYRQNRQPKHIIIYNSIDKNKEQDKVKDKLD